MGQSYIFNQAMGALGAACISAHFDILDGKLSTPLGPRNGYGWVEAGSAEVCFTAVLCLTYLAVATTTMPPSTTKTNFYYGFAIGSCITIGGFAIGHVSGGTLNPAVALGRSLAEVYAISGIKDKSKNWWEMLHCVYYSLYEFGGSIVAACIFVLTHQREYLKDGTNFPHVP